MRLHRGFVVAAALAVPAALTLSPASVQAESLQESLVKQFQAGLVNVDLGAVAVNLELGDITAKDLVHVHSLLTDEQVRVLDHDIAQDKIADHDAFVLTKLFRDTGLIGDDQYVVGVLSDRLFAIQHE
jgi:hypothetical protein